MKKTGFQAPNYTQVPNDFFDLINDGMTIAEIKVLSTLLRATLGYHRDEIEITIRELARITNLDPKSVMSGASKLEERGLITRSVGKITTKTKWTVVIDEPKLWEKILKTVGNDSYKNEPLPLKRKKEIKENDDEALAQSLKDVAMKELSKAYQSEIGMITPMIADELRDAIDTYPSKWIMDAIHESASQNKRSWKYVLAILTRWKAQGNQEAMKRPNTPVQSGSTKQDQSLANIQSWLAKKQEAANG